MSNHGCGQVYLRRDINDLEHAKFNPDASVKISPTLALSDAFGRMRTGDPFGVFDSKQVDDNDTTAWGNRIVGVGSSVLYNPNTSSTTLTAGANPGDFALEQTRYYWPYVPGRSHLVLLTGTMGAANAGFRKRFGYFDNNDGLGFLQDEFGDTGVFLRSSTTGIPVDTFIPQSVWNIDKMDGFGCSGIKLDLTASHIFVIDFQWLGVGTIRYGFAINGTVHFCHAIHNANITTGVYMRRPNLPVRYEIENVAGIAPASVERICCTVTSEGGYENQGFDFAVSNGAVVRAVNARTPVLAIRQAPTYNGEVNHKFAQVLSNTTFATGGNCFWEMRYLQDPSVVVGNFVPAGVGSSMEYSTDITNIVAVRDNLVDPSYTAAGAGQRGGIATGVAGAVARKARHTFLSRDIDNTNSEYMVMYATSLGGNLDVSASLNWVEFS